MKMVKGLGWLVAAGAMGFMAWNSDVRTKAIETLAYIAEMGKQSEIDQLAWELKSLEQEAAEIGLEMEQYQQLVSAMPNSTSAAAFERRIKHLQSRMLANQVAEGHRVAKIDRAVEPARDLLNQRADRLGYHREGTTVVVIDRPTDAQTAQQFAVTPARGAKGCN
jgi:hypothetical protein